LDKYDGFINRKTLSTAKEVEEVEVRATLSKKGGLDSEGSVWSVELNSSQLWRLDVASELSSGIKAALRVLAEPKSCLSAQTDPVRVAIVDSASHEASDAALAVAVKLDSTCESCPDASSAVADLGGHSQLGNNLPVGINSCAKAWSEGKVAVLSKEAIAGCNGSHCSQTKTSAGVREALVGVGIHCRNEGSEAAKDLLLLGTLGGSRVEAEESGVGGRRCTRWSRRWCWCSSGWCSRCWSRCRCRGWSRRGTSNATGEGHLGVGHGNNHGGDDKEGWRDEAEVFHFSFGEKLEIGGDLKKRGVLFLLRDGRFYRALLCAH